mgnify:CR=1 FL=1
MAHREPAVSELKEVVWPWIQLEHGNQFAVRRYRHIDVVQQFRIVGSSEK